MVLVTTAVGFYLGSRHGVNGPLLLSTLLGTALVAGGTSALNMYYEREEDGNRTESPLFTEIRGRGFFRELGQAPTGRPDPTVSRRPCRSAG